MLSWRIILWFAIWSLSLTALAIDQPTGRFIVSGTRILDPAGHEFIAHGVNINGENWIWPREMTQDAELITEEWQFNLVRVNCLLDGHFYTDNDLDHLVQEFTLRKVVTLIVADDKGADGYRQGNAREQLIEWFCEMATRYRDNPYVWFSPLDAPGADTPVSDKWLTFHRAFLAAIRGTGNENVIVCDSVNRIQGTGAESAELRYGAELLKNDGNIVFGFHVFSDWNSREALLGAYLDRAASQGLCSLITAYGSGEYAPDDSHPAVEAMLATCNARHIGRVAWHWYPGDYNPLTIAAGQGGWLIDKQDGSKPGNLSWLGEKAWEDNRAIPPEIIASPTPVTPTPAIPPVSSTPVILGLKPLWEKAIRINAAAQTPFTDSAGNVWEADRGFIGGNTIDHGNFQVEGTDNPTIYHTERFGLSGYSLPVANGPYLVRLHFTEAYFTHARERIFSVNVGGVEFRNMDVFDAVGFHHALIKEATVNVSDGKLDINFSSSVNLPEINALEIVPLGVAE